jgi:hypothetical protein
VDGFRFDLFFKGLILSGFNDAAGPSAFSTISSNPDLRSLNGGGDLDLPTAPGGTPRLSLPTYLLDVLRAEFSDEALSCLILFPLVGDGAVANAEAAAALGRCDCKEEERRRV